MEQTLPFSHLVTNKCTITGKQLAHANRCSIGFHAGRRSDSGAAPPAALAPSGFWKIPTFSIFSVDEGDENPTR